MLAADGEIRQGLPMSYLEFKTRYTSNLQSYMLESDISTRDLSARARRQCSISTEPATRSRTPTRLQISNSRHGVPKTAHPDFSYHLYQ